MKKLFVTLAISTIAVGAFAQGTLGNLIYQNTLGPGKEKRVLGVDAANPTSAVLGGTRAPVAAGYWAELWVGADGSEKAVDGSKVDFKTGATTAGLINGKSNLTIPGTFGGDTVTLRLRVWDSSVASWAEIGRPENGNKARGESATFTLKLGGIAQDGSPAGAPINMATALQSFGLYVVPEPSVIALGALGLGALVLRRRK